MLKDTTNSRKITAFLLPKLTTGSCMVPDSNNSPDKFEPHYKPFQIHPVNSQARPLSESDERHANSRLLISDRSDKFRKRYYPGTTKQEWNDYHWQLRKRFQNLNDLRPIISLSIREQKALTHRGQKFSVSITPYYASLFEPNNSEDPLRRTVIPLPDEFEVSDDESIDPLAEDTHSPVPGIVHRYPDRVLFLVTDVCPVYCRYCTRSRLVGGNAGFDINLHQWQQGIKYIADSPEVRDVLISGGDPLIYPDDRIEWLLARLRLIPHVEIIRLGTKIPCVLPQRITLELTRMLKRYHPVYVSLHVNHPREITPESTQACDRLADAGVPIGSQTVLLKNVNDDVGTLRTLMHQLLKIRVKPYYLLQCDPITGSSHFRTSIKTGIDIIRGLRGYTSGYAVPHYIVDLPGGGGKISLVPDYLTGCDNDYITFTNYRGINGFKYPDRSGQDVTNSQRSNYPKNAYAQEANYQF